MKAPRYMLIITLPVVLALCGSAAPSDLERLQVGDFRLYYTPHAAQSIHYKGSPIVNRMYFYTAVKPDTGKYIEGFNFRRNEDGFLTFAKERIDGGYRLTWHNKRYIYETATRRTDQIAGEATVTLTIADGEVLVRHQGKIEPNKGFGEIGFFVPEQRLTAGDEASYVATLANGNTVEGKLPLPAQEKQNILDGITKLNVKSPRETLDFTFTGQSFPGSYGLHFQDYRPQDQSPGCFRFVMNFSTATGNEFDYSWRLRVRSQQAVGADDQPEAAPPDPASLAKIPELPPGDERSPFGPAQVVTPRARGEAPDDGGLRADVSDKGKITLTDGGRPIVVDDYFHVFPMGAFRREESADGDIRHIRLRYDGPKGELVKEVVVSPAGGMDPVDCQGAGADPRRGRLLLSPGRAQAPLHHLPVRQPVNGRAG